MNSSRLWIALIVSATLAVAGRAEARGGLDLRIGACAPRGDSAVGLDCANPDSLIEIVGTFQVPDTVRNFVGIGITVDFEAEVDVLPAFWRFQILDGCNRSGLVLSDAIPEACGAATNVWGERGSEAFGGIAAYGVEYQGAHRGRLIGGIVRPATYPVDLVPGVDYYAFTLRLFTDNAVEAGGKCAGCRTPVRVVWSAASVGSVTKTPGTKPPADIVLTQARVGGSQCVRLNGAKGDCQPLPPGAVARPSDAHDHDSH